MTAEKQAGRATASELEHKVSGSRRDGSGKTTGQVHSKNGRYEEARLQGL